MDMERQDVPYHWKDNPSKKWRCKNHHFKIDAKLVFVALVRWEIDVCQKVSICASEVLINTCDMIAVERTSQIHWICKLVILTDVSFGRTLYIILDYFNSKF